MKRATTEHLKKTNPQAENLRVFNFGAEVRDGQGRDGDPRVYCFGKGTAAIEFVVSTDTTVHIEIRGAAFQAALQIAHTTQEWLRYGWNKDNEQAMLEREQEEAV